MHVMGQRQNRASN